MRDATERFYHEGRKAFYKYEKKRDKYFALANPYSATSFRGKEWQRGYNSSYFQNLERLNGKSRTVSKR